MKIESACNCSLLQVKIVKIELEGGDMFENLEGVLLREMQRRHGGLVEVISIQPVLELLTPPSFPEKPIAARSIKTFAITYVVPESH